MSSKKNRRALKQCETTTWIDELQELSPDSLKMLEETLAKPLLPEHKKPVCVIAGNRYEPRPFESILKAMKEIQALENDCPKPGQILDGYEVLGGMLVQDHYIVHLKPRKKG